MNFKTMSLKEVCPPTDAPTTVQSTKSQISFTVNVILRNICVKTDIKLFYAASRQKIQFYDFLRFYATWQYCCARF